MEKRFDNYADWLDAAPPWAFLNGLLILLLVFEVGVLVGRS